MSYLNNQVGYREDLLTTRSVIKKDNYVILEPDGLVKNAIPGYENCDVTILGSPAMGASFADYLVTARDGGKNDGIGGEGLETFLYVISGEVTVKNADKEEVLTEGGYIFSPESNKVSFANNSGKEAKLYVYKRRYERIEG
ncbi:MAG: (S)-ureidoglycine aminohydrolase, partial [[Clostridium] scindens]|nr:(S)-ureidoglycine aminohydrolase [[Clostridium] scindens]